MTSTRPLPWSYPLIMLAAVAVAAVLSRKRQSALGLTARERLGVGLGAFCGAMIGAKLPFVLSDWPGLVSGRAWFENGKTIVFGMVGGYLGVELAKASLGVGVKTGDSFAVPVAAAVAVGRLGCFVGGCCIGTETGSEKLAEHSLRLTPLPHPCTIHHRVQDAPGPRKG
jgi:phosphatidylglycerol:prolipoprotein diacylglycerol transferase